MESGEDNPVPAFVMKQLLEDIESSGLPRGEVNLLLICNDNPKVYGLKGSRLRRNIQKRFARIKRLGAKAYLRLLEDYEVNNMKNCDEGLTSSFKNMVFDDTEDDNEEEAPVTPLRTTKKKKQSPMRTGTRSGSRKLPDKLSDDESYSSIPPVSIISSRSSLSLASSKKMSEDGTKSSPWIVHVNTQHAERNREFGVEKTIKDEVDGTDRDGWYIRRTVAVPDYDKWDASLLDDDDVPRAYKNRCIRVKGPSQDFWQNNAERFSKKTSIVEAVAKAIEATELAINQDESRQWSFWLLVFPSHITLDNKIYSSNDVDLDPDFNCMPISKTDNDFNKDIMGMVVCWHIAEAGGRMVTKTKKKPKASDFFKDEAAEAPAPA
jgi:hypothetical protein